MKRYRERGGAWREVARLRSLVRFRTLAILREAVEVYMAPDTAVAQRQRGRAIMAEGMELLRSAGCLEDDVEVADN